LQQQHRASSPRSLVARFELQLGTTVLTPELVDRRVATILSQVSTQPQQQCRWTLFLVLFVAQAEAALDVEKRGYLAASHVTGAVRAALAA
jgi:hypothetical protein